MNLKDLRKEVDIAVNTGNRGVGFTKLELEIVERPKPLIAKNGNKIVNALVKDTDGNNGRLSLFRDEIEKWKFETGDIVIVDGFAKLPYNSETDVVDITLGKSGKVEIK